MTQFETDDKRLIGARYKSSGVTIPTYDDGFGKLYISRNSIGLNGIVRAQSWETAYGICEDEFFPEADETMEEIVKEYGFRRDHLKVVKDNSVTHGSNLLAAGERFAVYPADYPDGKLAPEFIRWQTVETPDPDAWSENELFQEAFGFRPNGPRQGDTLNHGIYAKDLNGDALDVLTVELADDLGIELLLEDES